MSGQYPKLGALAVCLRGQTVLLAKRRNPPDAGLWGYPGGHVEFGETLAQAALRELHEETGVTATPGPTIGHMEFIHRDGEGGVTHHFLLGAVLCAYETGAATAADDAEAVAWIPFEEVLAETLPMSDKVAETLRQVLSAQARPSASLR